MDTHWLPLGAAESEIDVLCLGTGRFLRSVLVPALVGGGYKPALIQTRGRSFLEFMKGQSQAAYPVETVLHSGEIQTRDISCYGAFSLGKIEDKLALLEFLPKMKRLSIVGIGVTEAGLASSETKVVSDLYELMKKFKDLLSSSEWDAPSTPNQKIIVIDMDNVPNNGDIILKHLLDIAGKRDESDEMSTFLSEKVAFLNTMVDRITSQREGSNGMVPRCEPTPAKALVIEDKDKELPSVFHEMKDSFGVLCRSDSLHFQGDLALKLRVANATHTAIAHVMALLKLTTTDFLSSSNPDAKILMAYLGGLFDHQILPASFPGLGQHSEETQAAWDDWRPRLTHAHFGLSTFFITQNGAAKGGVRLGPNVISLVESNQPLSVAMVYAFAALLRWLTPRSSGKPINGVYTGWFHGSSRVMAEKPVSTDTVQYADGLRHNFEAGWYEFRCACNITTDAGVRSISTILGEIDSPAQPHTYINPIRGYLLAEDGGNLSCVASSPAFGDFTSAVATLYARMVAGDSPIEMLEEMLECGGVYEQGFATSASALVDNIAVENGHPLFYRLNPLQTGSKLLEVPCSTSEIKSIVFSEVASASAIDLHTHLLPPSHGSLSLWGIDELLTYHYLVAEYFMTAPFSISPESFYALNKKEQADLIWKALFLERSPVSEACRGVLTTLRALGLQEHVATRDLAAIRRYYGTFRNDGFEGAHRFSEMVFSKAGVRYAIMTNIPFDANEAQYWRPQKKPYGAMYRSALRVDPLLAGDHVTIESALKAGGYDTTLEGATQYLRDWCDTMKPEYMMASTPHDFVLKEGILEGVEKTGVDLDAMQQPFAFVDQTSNGATCSASCDGAEDQTPSLINEKSDFLSEVLMKVCEERDLPIALKIGAHRGVNPALKSAGDGMVAFADAGLLGRLCARFPKVSFLATFLSRSNQHEAAVLATKFRNLHIYGCWWFCNNPSIIEEITKMRIEMLGTAFTAQHSDARVLDQLMYKWPHSRAVIAKVLCEEYKKLTYGGWKPTRAEVRRDITRLFGGSYEEFASKSSNVV